MCNKEKITYQIDLRELLLNPYDWYIYEVREIDGCKKSSNSE
jgi:hypothetical protein